MKLHSKAERWEFADHPQFLYTLIIFQDGSDYFWAHSKEREIKVDTNDPVSLDLHQIPNKHLFPLFEGGLSQFKNSDSSAIYTKRPRLTAYRGSPAIASVLLEETRTCQVLMKYPHQNIARYFGCIIEEGRIIGLCFEKYAETLGERLDRGTAISEGGLQKVEAGMRHLHTLNLVHNDLGLENVMFRSMDDEEPVIIDFDSCVVKGSPLPSKRGPVPDGVETAEFENDLLGMSRIRATVLERGLLL